MPKIAWELNSFQGIHTQPAKVANGHLYADDMKNLRIDGDGWLQLRSDVIALDPDGDNITGVAASHAHIFTLRNGRLFVRGENSLESEIEITAVSNEVQPIHELSGRLSLVDFGTYVILTSEGEDQGLIIDLRGGQRFSFRGVPLGLDPPGADALAVSAIQGESALAAGIYHYRIVYVSAHHVSAPWYGMTSNPSPTKSVDIASDQVGRITFSVPNNDLHTGAYIYRAKAVPGLSANRHTYTRIDNLQVNGGSDLPKTSQSFRDVATELEAAEGEVLRTDNDRLASEVKQIYRYNDLVFGAAGARLVYSDLRSGNIVPWAFPVVNEVRVEGKVDFCAALNEVLLFGSRDGLWRLTGGTEYDFAVGQISGSGAIDGYAWAKITDALAFVGEGGLFLTDASAVVRISELVLDDFFVDKKVVSGAVAFFKDNDVLSAVQLKNTDDTIESVQFKREDNYWVRWDLPFLQSASIVSENEATLVLVADGTGQLKRLDWNSTANDEEDIAWLWESQPLDAAEVGAANRRKRFAEFQFTGEADNEMMLEVFKENEVDPAAEATFSARDSLIPVRVPINRIARRLRFKLSGTGPVKIQGMRVVIGI